MPCQKIEAIVIGVALNKKGKNESYCSLGQTGSTLINIIVGAGVGLVMLLGMMSLFNTLNRSVKSSSQGADIIYLHEDIHDLLRIPDACKVTFQTMIVPDLTDGTFTTVTTIKKADGTTAYDTTSLYSNGNLKITQMQLGGYSASDPAVDPNTGTAVLKLTFTKQGGSVIGGSLINRQVSLSVTRDASKKVVTCVAVGGSDSIWVKKSNNDIYYLGGNVGVGTNSPTALFQVAGPGSGIARIGDFTATSNSYDLQLQGCNDGLSCGVTVYPQGNIVGLTAYTRLTSTGLVSTNGGISLYPNGPAGGAALSVIPSGNVGVGTTNPQAKLDVSGAVRFGTESNCSGSNEGAQRYNSAQKRMEFCDGTLWKSIGGGSANTWIARGSSPNPTIGNGWGTLAEMQINMTPSNSTNPILIFFNGSFQNSGAGAPEIRLMVDGMERARRNGNENGGPAEYHSIAIHEVVTLSQSPHTISIQWHSTGGGIVTALDVRRSLIVVELLNGQYN